MHGQQNVKKYRLQFE